MQRLSFAAILAGVLASVGFSGASAAPLRGVSGSSACDAQGMGRQGAAVHHMSHDRRAGRHHAGTRGHRRIIEGAPSPDSVPFGEVVSGYQYGDGTYAYGPNGGLPVYSAGAYSPGPRIIHIPRGHGRGRHDD